MIYKEIPKQFNPKFEVVSCFIEHNKEILLLHRQDYKPEGNTWGVPAGKIDKRENPLDAILREILQETGYDIPISQISYYRKVYVKYSDKDFIYHIFHTKLSDKQEVTLNPAEHKDFKWEMNKKIRNEDR